MGYLTDFLIGIGGSLIAAEVCANADRLAAFLIRIAVRRMPEGERERRLEEWLAHLDDTPGVIRKLLHGLGCWFGAPSVARALAKGRPVSASQSRNSRFHLTVFRVVSEMAEDASRRMAEDVSGLFEGKKALYWLLGIISALAGFLVTAYALDLVETYRLLPW
jgi:hypothetical protein